MSSDPVRDMAKRIASRISGESQRDVTTTEVTSIQEIKRSLNDIQRRLTQIESRLGSPATTSPWSSQKPDPSTHPAHEQFDVGEAVSELVDFLERERVCDIEPGGKPCDHCGICSTRGF
jgi:hypothetical protein